MPPELIDERRADEVAMRAADPEGKSQEGLPSGCAKFLLPLAWVVQFTDWVRYRIGNAFGPEIDIESLMAERREQELQRVLRENGIEEVPDGHKVIWIRKRDGKEVVRIVPTVDMLIGMDSVKGEPEDTAARLRPVQIGPHCPDGSAGFLPLGSVDTMDAYDPATYRDPDDSEN